LKKKKAENILKCKNLTIETERMWNVKTNVILVITGATGSISLSFIKHLSNIPGKPKVKEL
jgi:FlaA1/EpsC-like NDP-sugar epimerase